MTDKPEPLSLDDLQDLRRRIAASPPDSPPDKWQFTKDEVRLAIKSMIADVADRHLQIQATPSKRRKAPKLVGPNPLDALLTGAEVASDKKD